MIVKNVGILFFLFIFLISACNPEDLISEFGDSVITAKSKVGEVLNTAMTDFADDAKLAAIYGLNVDSKGQVDLQKPTENAFVYTVQSDINQSNEFYVPVYKSSPIESPITFDDMLPLVKNETARDLLVVIFGKLSNLHIEASASYDDSPAVLTKMFARNDVATFRMNNPESKIDMFLLPSKAINDSLGNNNYADWIVNFYADSSLVMWLNTESGDIKNLSEL